jgi:hypothetical protein
MLSESSLLEKIKKFSLLSMYNRVVNSDLSEQVFMNNKLQDQLLLSSGDWSCKCGR